MHCEIREVSLTALATMYVSWNCNQTFITEKLTVAAALEERAPRLLPNQWKKLFSVFCCCCVPATEKYVAFLLHLHTFDYDPKLATEDTNTNIQIHPTPSYHNVGGHFQFISIHLIFQTLI